MHETFNKNFDKFEEYTKRNIYSLPPALEAQVNAGVLTPGSNKRRRTSTGAGNTSSNSKLPESAAAVPTKKAMESLDAELAVLRSKVSETPVHPQTRASGPRLLLCKLAL